MAKKNRHNSGVEYEHQRGEIKDNAIKALVTSPLFRAKIEQPLKGKGSYKRKGRNNKIAPSSHLHAA